MVAGCGHDGGAAEGGFRGEGEILSAGGIREGRESGEGIVPASQSGEGRGLPEGGFREGGQITVGGFADGIGVLSRAHEGLAEEESGCWLRGAAGSGRGEEFLEPGGGHVREFVADGLSGRPDLKDGGGWFRLAGGAALGVGRERQRGRNRGEPGRRCGEGTVPGEFAGSGGRHGEGTGQRGGGVGASAAHRSFHGSPAG